NAHDSMINTDLVLQTVLQSLNEAKSINRVSLKKRGRALITELYNAERKYSTNNIDIRIASDLSNILGQYCSSKSSYETAVEELKELQAASDKQTFFLEHHKLYKERLEQTKNKLVKYHNERYITFTDFQKLSP